MSESIDGVVPLDSMLVATAADVLGAGDPSGQTLFYLLDAIDRHAAAEATALGQYEYLERASDDPVIALVMRLILEDEDRDHGLLRRIATTLEDTLNWRHSPSALPHATRAESTGAEKELVALARELIGEERTGAQALRRLAQRQRSFDGGLDTLLLEMMATDSDKHARLLEFVERRLEARMRMARS